MESTNDSSVDYKFEVVVIPVLNVDRAKSFYVTVRRRPQGLAPVAEVSALRAASFPCGS